MKPIYPAPTKEMINESLEEASATLERDLVFKRLVTVDPKEIFPRRDKSYKLVESELDPRFIEFMKSSPEDVIPIVVSRISNKDPWEIEDGAHRTLSAQKARLELIWAIEVLPEVQFSKKNLIEGWQHQYDAVFKDNGIVEDVIFKVGRMGGLGLWLKVKKGEKIIYYSPYFNENPSKFWLDQVKTNADLEAWNLLGLHEWSQEHWAGPESQIPDY